jgi:hypothetical protein
MKYVSFRSFFIVLGLVAGLGVSSCKDKAKENPDSTIKTEADTASVSTGSPEISTDTTLAQGLKDATKDYPGVTATVANGEVTLTGTIERDKLPALLQSVNGLNPKKVNNQLTIK